MHIIQVPSARTCKLPGGEWLNLGGIIRRELFPRKMPSQIRSIQIENTPMLVMVIWSNGSSSFYRRSQAEALLEAWGEAKGVDKERAKGETAIA